MHIELSSLVKGWILSLNMPLFQPNSLWSQSSVFKTCAKDMNNIYVLEINSATQPFTGLSGEIAFLLL